MKDFKETLTTFIQVVTFLFAAFGGFLKKIAPPDQVGASFPVGVLSFLTLIVLMIITSLGQEKASGKSYRPWLIAGTILFLIACPTAFLYPRLLGSYTYPQASPLQERKINASDAYLSSHARLYKSTHPEVTVEGLSRNLPDGDVWTETGIQDAEQRLLLCYACLVLSLSGAIFCLLEANKRREGGASAPGSNG
jgi:hypothetical protein